MGGPRVGDRSALTSRCQGVVSRPRPGGRKGRKSSERNAPGSASSKPSCLRSNSEFFPHGPNHLITSSSHTGRTTRSPLSLSPPLPPLSVAAVAVVVATIAVVTVVARAVATVAAAVATVAVAADAVAAFTVAVATVAATEYDSHLFSMYSWYVTTLTYIIGVYRQIPDFVPFPYRGSAMRLCVDFIYLVFLQVPPPR